jgi:hypothetical protein
MKSRRMRQMEHPARMGDREVRTGFWRKNLMERDHLEDLGFNEMAI